MIKTILAANTLALSLPWALCRAEPAATPVGDSLSSPIIVFGRAEAKIGAADAAGEGSIGGGDLLVRPLLRLAELLEAVPGMVAAQRSRSGKANQYFLRGFYPSVGQEPDARLQRSGVTLTATYWWLNVDSALRFVRDSNAVEPSGASHRRGYEIVAFCRPSHWLALDGDYTASHSRYDIGDHISNAFENAASAGVAVLLAPWETSVQVRQLGSSPLIEDNSVRDQGSTVLNFRGGWKRKRPKIYGEFLNILANQDKDAAYYHESDLPAHDTAGLALGRLSRVVEPRTVRLGAKVAF